ncbi:unnamed protein product [Ectocarpus fasciculatus]
MHTQLVQCPPRFLFVLEHMHFTVSNPPGQMVTLGNLRTNITQPPSTSVFSMYPIPSHLGTSMGCLAEASEPAEPLGTTKSQYSTNCSAPLLALASAARAFSAAPSFP